MSGVSASDVTSRFADDGDPRAVHLLRCHEPGAELAETQRGEGRVPVRVHGPGIVAHVRGEIQRVERRLAHASVALGEGDDDTVLVT